MLLFRNFHGKLFAAVFVLFLYYADCFSQKFTISGYISDSESGESLIRAAIYVPSDQTGTITNFYGYYTLDLTPGVKNIVYRYLGFSDSIIRLELKRDTVINILLKPQATLLNEVVIVAVRDTGLNEKHSASLDMAILNIGRISEIPSLGGETDIMKVVQLLPGVKQGIEGTNNMYVRGGDGDQNLILLDEAPVYNVSHLFGFFSVFNPHAIKDITLIKSGFPASYGGRLSSVLDIRMKDGNMKKFEAEGGIGLLSSRITLQGPVVKERMSFILSGRRTYIDQVFRTLYGGDPLPYYFYDINGKINYKLSDRDRFYISSYIGDDFLRFKTDFEDALFGFRFLLGNITTSARWNHLFSKKLFCNTSLIHTRFRYDVSGRFADNSILVKSSIRDVGIKSDFEYSLNQDCRILFGADYIYHHFRPNVVSTVGRISEIYQSRKGAVIYTHESALYGLNEINISQPVAINYGIRFSMATISERTYPALEPRINATVRTGQQQKIKGSYTRLYQYMHLVSSSSVALPVDLWYPVTRNIKPQYADHYSLGYLLDIPAIHTEISSELYYKLFANLIEYRPGAVLLLNDNYEDELITGNGTAYGTELLIKKYKGRFNGWIGYTLSWAKRQFDELNDGEEFFAKYDRRHDVSAVVNFAAFRRVELSMVWVFTSGAHFTPLTGQFLMPNVSLTNIDILPVYAGKNSETFPPSHRLDINIVFKNPSRKKYYSEFHIGGYNIYNRTQPFLVEVVETTDGKLKYQARGLFGFIPSFGYVFRF